MNNGMAESCGGVAELKNVDQGTLARFIEWAYKGYYAAALHSLQAVSPNPAQCSSSIFSSENDHMKANPFEDVNDWASCFSGKKKRVPGRMFGQLKQSSPLSISLNPPNEHSDSLFSSEKIPSAGTRST